MGAFIVAATHERGFGEHPLGGIQNCATCEAWLFGRRKKEGRVVYGVNCEHGLLRSVELGMNLHVIFKSHSLP